MVQEALKYVTKYGADKVRLLEFTKNRGKGGAIRIVSGHRRCRMIVLICPLICLLSCRDA